MGFLISVILLLNKIHAAFSLEKLDNNVKKIKQVASAKIKDRTGEEGRATLATGGKHISATLKNMIDIQSTFELSNTKYLTKYLKKRKIFPHNQFVKISFDGGWQFFNVT